MLCREELLPRISMGRSVNIRNQRDELTIVRAALKHTSFPKDDMKEHVKMLERATALAEARKGYGKGSGGSGVAHRQPHVIKCHMKLPRRPRAGTPSQPPQGPRRSGHGKTGSQLPRR